MTREDIGARAVAAIRARLMVDEEWSVDLADGFAWWGHDLRQEIVAEPATGEGEAERARVIVRTDVGRGIRASGAELATTLAEINDNPIGGAARARPDGTLVIEAVFPAGEDTLPWIVPTATTASTLALTIGRAIVEQQLGHLGGGVAASAHPTSGPRPFQDDMLNLPRQFGLFAAQEEAQNGPCPWSQDAEWEQTARLVTELGVGISTAGGPGLSAEFALRPLRPGEAPTAALNPDLPTALLRAQWESDSPLGPGIILRLFLPYDRFPGYGSLAHVAATLNQAEIERGGMPNEPWPAHFGAWTVKPSLNEDRLVTYFQFVPAMLATRVSLPNLVIHHSVRARNVTRWLAPPTVH